MNGGQFYPPSPIPYFLTSNYARAKYSKVFDRIGLSNYAILVSIAQRANSVRLLSPVLPSIFDT